MFLTPVFILSLVLFFTACAPQPTVSPYIPPQSGTSPTMAGAGLYTPPPQPTSIGETHTPSVNQGVATPSSSCVSNLRFVEDVSYPDGSVVRPGEKIEKIWRVENNGTCNWDSRFSMRLVEGDQLGAPAELALYPARPETQADLRVIFIAPLESRYYKSTWQAVGPDNFPFGDPFYIDIFVQYP
jgi:hypothetical protein